MKLRSSPKMKNEIHLHSIPCLLMYLHFPFSIHFISFLTICTTFPNKNERIWIHIRIPIRKLHHFFRFMYVCIHQNVKHEKRIDRRSFYNGTAKSSFVLLWSCVTLLFLAAFAIRWFLCTLFYISCSTKWLYKKWIKHKTGMERTITKQHTHDTCSPREKSTC